MAQNGQAIPQPAWLETHSVIRSGYRISTDSISVPSCAFHSVLRVSPASQASERTSVSSSGSSASTNSARPSAGRSVISAASRVSPVK